MTSKLIANWQKKNYQLSQLIIDSLEGLDVWETVLAPYRRQIETEKKNLAAIMSVNLENYWNTTQKA